MSRRLRDFSTIMEKSLISERMFASSLPVAPRSAIPLQRLSPDNEVGLLWDRLRQRDGAKRMLDPAEIAQDCVPA